MNLNDFLKKFPPPGKILFAKVWGSRSHNTHLPTSDTDFSGVFWLPTSALLSAYQPGEQKPISTFKHDKEDTPGVSKDEHPDYQFFEVGWFAELLLKGNPMIVEMLYTETEIISTPAWQDLRRMRDRFLSQESVKQYLGYMQGRLKRLIANNGQKGLHTKGGSYNEKWAYHILRLAEDAKRIAQGKPPVVWKEGPERDFLLKVRRNEFEWPEVQVMIEKAIADVDALKPWKIPEYGDKQGLNRWLLELRREYWEESPGWGESCSLRGIKR